MWPQLFSSMLLYHIRMKVPGKSGKPVPIQSAIQQSLSLDYSFRKMTSPLVFSLCRPTTCGHHPSTDLARSCSTWVIARHWTPTTLSVASIIIIIIILYLFIIFVVTSLRKRFLVLVDFSWIIYGGPDVETVYFRRPKKKKSGYFEAQMIVSLVDLVKRFCGFLCSASNSVDAHGLRTVVCTIQFSIIFTFSKIHWY